MLLYNRADPFKHSIVRIPSNTPDTATGPTSSQTSTDTTSATPTSSSTFSTSSTPRTTFTPTSAAITTAAPPITTTSSPPAAITTPSTTVISTPSTTSSSSVTTSAPTTAIVGFTPGGGFPQTTYYATFTGSAPNIATSSTGLPSAQSHSSSPKGFLANKGAVGATFTFVSLAIIAILAFGAKKFLRKRNAAWQLEDDAYFEKYVPQDHAPVVPAPLSIEGTEDPEANMTEAMAPSTVNAYPDRQIHYGNMAPQPSVYDNYGAGYPPRADYQSQGGGYQTQRNYFEGQVQHSTQPSLGSAYPRQFAGTQSAAQAGLVPPVALREPGARGSGYDQSIDSFYGASGADDNSVHAY